MSQEDENKPPLSRKGQREVSAFIGHELLYDYVSGSLDPERMGAVSDHLKFSRDAQLDLEKIQNGQNYALKLNQTVVSQSILDRINAPVTYLSGLLQKTQFEKWPQGVKLGLEALFVVAAMVLLLTVTPWQKVFEWGQGLNSKELILSEIPKGQSVLITEEKPDFIDEELNETITQPANAEKKSKSTTASPEVVAIPPAPTVAAPTKDSKAAATVATAASPVAVTSPATSTGGFLYRGEFEVTNLNVTGPKITEKITSLGGRKAGSVELGWKKTETSMYYHFTIPESRYSELLTFLQTYGTVNFSKEKHPRVMPDGIVRVIFTVDEGQP